MPLYDYKCHKCDFVVEKFHMMDDSPKFYCPDCHDIPLVKLMSFGGLKRPDAPWIRDINGYINDLEFVNKGREERIETREQARKKIKELYATPYPRAKDDSEVAANKRVGELRQRYLERF